MRLIRSWEIPIHTISEANRAEHWSKGFKRHRQQKNLIRCFMSDLALYRDFPYTVKLIRLSRRKLDEHDNLPMAFKYIVDQIADLMFPGQKAGKADDTDLIEWNYAQEKGKKSTRIELYKKDDE